MLTPHRAVILLFFLTAAVYEPTLSFPTVYEDHNDPDTLFAEPQWALTQIVTKPARSLTNLSFDVNKALFGPASAMGFHAGNLALHLVNGLLLLLLLPVTWASVFIVGVWWLHPLQVESVAYISSRSDLLLITCVLAGVVAVQRGWFGWAAVCAVGAILAKEVGIIAAPLLAWHAWRRWDGPLPWKPAIPAAVVGLWVLWLFRAELSWDPAWTMAELVKAWRFAWMVVWPAGFSIDHDWRWITGAVPLWGLLGTLFAMGVAVVRPRSRFAYALGWALIALTPRLIVPLYEGLHEHHMTLPLLGVALGAGLYAPQGELEC